MNFVHLKKLLSDNRQGTSLIEVLVGIAILVLVSVSLFALFDFTLRVLWENKARLGAQALANQQIELAYNLPYNDVGTVGGIPNGVIDSEQSITRNGISYTVKTAVIYIDDPFDGTLGGNPEDLLPTDYKRIRVEVSWPFRLSSKPVVFLTDIVPNGIESGNGGGTLRITAINASGLPVPQANVHIENNLLNPAVNVDLLTNDNGQVILPGALASVEGYEVTVTKSGYSTDKTYATDPVNLPTPIKPHLTVVEGSVTDSTFSIDLLSSMDTFVFLTQNSEPGWWNSDYTSRRRITITNNSSKTISTGYSVKYEFDHGNQVGLGKSLSSGDDVRILWWNGSSQVWQELDRVATTPWNSADDTEIWFAIKNAIPSGSSSNDYFIYYNNSNAGTPPSDSGNVFKFYDDFENPDYTYANWATSSSAWIVTNGEYRQSSNSSEEIATAGSSEDDVMVQVDVRMPGPGNDAGIIGRYDNNDNYYIGRPTDLPVQIEGTVNNNDYVLGQRSLVQASDGTLAVFAAFPDTSEYKMYTSTDNGRAWTQPWTLSTGGNDFSSNAWIDQTNNTIYFVYTDYSSVSDEYRLQMSVFSYDGGTKSWSTGAPSTLILSNYNTRPYRPSVIKNGNTVFVSYARLDGSGFHEIAVRTSTDNGVSWSSESWLSDWNIFFSDKTERESLNAELVIYEGDVVAILNNSRSFGWRTFNGSTWSSYEELKSNTYQNRAITSVVTGTGSNQNLHIFYRNAGDSGRPHEYKYNGTSWSDTTIATMTSNFAYVASYSDNADKIVFYFGTPNDGVSDKLYAVGQYSGEWAYPQVAYSDTVPIRSISVPATGLQDGLTNGVFIAGANNSRKMFYYGMAHVGLPGSSNPLVSLKSSGTILSVTPAETSVTTNKKYRIELLFTDDLVTGYVNGTLAFGDTEGSVARGQVGLYSLNTEAYFDNVIMRDLVIPEPETSGALEESYNSADPISGIPVLVRGSKLIGYDIAGDPLYKFEKTYTSDSDGSFSIPSLEWDSYDFIISDADTGYDVMGIDPPDPVAVNPDTNVQVNIYLTNDTSNSLRVKVLDVNDQPIELASVNVTRTNSYDNTIETTSYGQAFFASLLNNADYDISVSKSGYYTANGSVTVNGSSTATMILSSTDGPPPGSPPLAPTMGEFTNIGETTMTLNWTDNATDEDGYKIYRNTSSSKPSNEIATLGSNSVLYPATGLDCNTTYYWWVEAYNSSGANDDNGSQATLSCPTPPNAPTMQSFSGVTDTTMTLNWTDNASNEDGYRIYKSTSNTKPGSPITTLSANAETYSATGLDCNTTYYWWVEAYNSQGTADDSDSQITLSCPSGIVFSDTFTENSNTTLTSHTPDLGDSWTQIIEIINYGSSRLRVRSSSDDLRRDTCNSNEGALYRADVNMTGADYEVRVTQINGDTGNDYNFLAARIVDANNMYAFKWNETRGQLYKRVGGVWYTLGPQVSGSGTPLNDGSTITLKVDGTTISAIDDGNTLVSVTDSEFSGAGYAGVGMGALVGAWDDCSSQRLDNFEVEIF